MTSSLCVMTFPRIQGGPKSKPNCCNKHFCISIFYRSLIRSRLDCDCVVNHLNGSARTCTESRFEFYVCDRRTGTVGLEHWPPNFPSSQLPKLLDSVSRATNAHLFCDIKKTLLQYCLKLSANCKSTIQVIPGFGLRLRVLYTLQCSFQVESWVFGPLCTLKALKKLF